ncbi:hypothetical protein [Streptomyces sp. AK02-01A]|uniref:hypothetical protein n=1 Tax=Streptomyces sp. AK02-01A TaxID=3028648 RepID=UPI0029A36BA0|nr:hypothetical protein [Streptomyces sp. AK02-01A]MDX3855671.1 hypothetical protein [Streptomyces sp. AK02-01A]
MTDASPYAASVAYADTAGDGALGREWLFGVPYAGSDGDLLPWCLHCGAQMVAPCSPGDTGPYVDLADGETDPVCKDDHDHFPVYLWTPHDAWYTVNYVDLTSVHRAADLNGAARIGPFDVGELYGIGAQHQRHQRNPAEEERHQQEAANRHKRQRVARYRALYRQLTPLNTLSSRHAQALLYDVAGVPPGQRRPPKELYRTIATRWHPDREDGDAQVFALATEAYRIVAARSAVPRPAPPSDPPPARPSLK